MNSNIEKILYIGVGMLLLAVAFTLFFSNYNQYKNYISGSIKITNYDRIATVHEENAETYTPGYEVVHLILEQKKKYDEIDISTTYSDTLSVLNRENPELWVSGRKAPDIDLSQIDPAVQYVVYYQKDSSGKITKVYYNIR